MPRSFQALLAGILTISGCGFGRSAAHAEEALLLRERIAPGYSYHVSTRTDLAGSLNLISENGQPAGKSLSITGRSAIEYDERVLAADSGGPVRKTLRIYRRIDFDRKVGDQLQQNTIRPAVRRLVLLRHQNVEVPYSPDGPLTWGEIDLVRTDVFTPALSGLFADKPVRPGERWTASNEAMQELTDLERIEEGAIECRLEEVTLLERRRHARVAFAGVVRGVNEDGPNRQRLEGYFFFDLESNHLSYLSVRGTNFLLDKAGKEIGKVQGQFVLTRQFDRQPHDLGDLIVRNLTLEPNADNTQLLYDNPDLGVRFLYPRRWHVAGVRGRQVAIDEPGGSGVLLTLESPATTPTGTQYLAEVRDWLAKQKGAVNRTDQPRSFAGTAGSAERFALDVELGGQRVLMAYYVIRQPAGGATLAGRLLAAGDLDGLQGDLDRMVRSLTITRAPVIGSKK